MVSSDLGTCEWFVWDLRRSGLIDRGQLDQVVGEFLKRNPRAEPPALAEFLVGQKILSPFQAERILQGKTQGLVLGPYILVDSIGSGSMGQVYKASSKTDSQWYAVKVLPRRSMWNVRLARRQVRAFSQFTHPAVVPFVDVGTSGGQHYLVWPLVEGETLESRILREGKFSPEYSAQVISQVAQGLAVSHQHGLFHGLLKPSNIMIGPDNQARILDFGIGSLLVENEGESLVDTMSTANTLTSGLDCSSPESIMEPTNRTPAGDQYSLGCILYYCLSGQYPFPDGTAVEKMMAHQFKQPTSISDLVPSVSDGLQAIVERLMQKSPESRFSGADEIVDSLQPFAAEIPQRRTSNSVHGMAPRSALGSSHHGSVSPSKAPPSSFGNGSVHIPPPSAPIPPQMPTGHGGGSVSRLSSTSSMASIPPMPAMPPTTRVQAPIPPATPVPPSVSNSPRMSDLSRRSFQPGPEAVMPEALPYTEAYPSNSGDSGLNPQQMEAPQANRNGTAPGWVEQPRTPVLGPLMIFVIAALVTGFVYLLGKNFLFPNY